MDDVSSSVRREIIDLNRLRTAFNQLLDGYMQSNGSEYIADQSYYWAVAVDEMFTMGRRAPKPGIGDLGESYQQLLSEAESGQPIGYSLVWLGDIIRAIGATTP